VRPEDHVGERLDAWRTGELAPDERERVEAHLAGCERCREELAALEAWAETFERGMAARGGHATTDEPDWAGQRAAIVARTSGKRSRATGRGLWRWAPQVALVAVAALVVGIVWQERRDEPALPSGPAPRQAPVAVGTEAEAVGRADDRSEGQVDATPAAPAPEAPPAERKARAFAERDALEEPAREEVRRQAEPAGNETALADRVAPAAEAGQAAVVEKAADADEAADDRLRFRSSARTALEREDTLGARRALRYWTDTLAPRLEPVPEGEAALADSLEALLRRTE
jgi:hypothetical protein